MIEVRVIYFLWIVFHYMTVSLKPGELTYNSVVAQFIYIVELQCNEIPIR